MLELVCQLAAVRWQGAAQVIRFLGLASLNVQRHDSIPWRTAGPPTTKCRGLFKKPVPPLTLSYLAPFLLLFSFSSHLSLTSIPTLQALAMQGGAQGEINTLTTAQYSSRQIK